MSHPMDPYFAPPEGRLFACFPGAEERPGQRRMAELVHDAILDGAERVEAWRAESGDPDTKPGAMIQAVEAGTGIGKSLGYLVPSLAAGRHPVIVATRTKQLQRQLLDLDVPRAEGILGRRVKAVLAKGRSNYLCLDAWDRVQAQPPKELSRLDYGMWTGLSRWAAGTLDGDREGMGRHGEGESELWDRINARSERCTGRQCPRYGDCFLTRLRQEVLQADLVIVNHALLLADRVLRESAFGQVLPDAPVLIVDEAHDLEEQITESCSEVWTSRAMTLLFRDLQDEGGRHTEGAALLACLSSWEDAWADLLTLVPAMKGVMGFDDPRVPITDLADAVEAWVEAGQGVWQEARRLAQRAAVPVSGGVPVSPVGDPAKDTDEMVWRKLADRIGLAFARMEQVFAQAQGWVSTLQQEGPGTVVFRTSPVDVRPLFHQHLRRGFECLVLTSATLRDGSGFNGLRLRLGLSESEAGRGELVESPFDFPAQARLFIPPGLPERKAGRDELGESGWVEAGLDAIERLLRASRGRALVLFTSRKALQGFRSRLEMSLPDMTFFVQGEALGRHQMMERFRSTPRAVLLGLASFWQGVDLPGDDLVLVVVTALPFAPPDDPVLRARIAAAETERPGLGFIGIQVPQMTLKLKQGLGRLIRTRTDRGVVALLDPRILMPHEDRSGKRYAAQVRAALQPFPITRDWEEVEAFLGSL